MSDEEKTVNSDFLFARPSVLSGIARLFDLWGKYDEYNTSRSTDEADMRALYSDWRITGQDIRGAWSAYHQNEAEKSPPTEGQVVCRGCGKIISHAQSGVVGKAQKKIHRRDHRRGAGWVQQRQMTSH
ncbi:MAG: hypothetical protein WCD12_14985 [Candidatus Binatus sp.]|uniref:hypothetical protein n=1 Tax=Candidatus Binatus sp. TaxID=2811406 RepID=UPI003C78333A